MPGSGGGARLVGLNVRTERKGAADTMARLIDYGMRAGGIAEREKKKKKG